MTAPPERTPASDAEVRRSRLIGRIVILGFGVLLLIYFVPLAWHFIQPNIGPPTTPPPASAPPR